MDIYIVTELRNIHTKTYKVMIILKMQHFTTMLALVILQQSGITSIIQHVFLRVCQERSREVGSH